MQENKVMPPLGPILGEEVAPVRPHQERRHVLLQVRTGDPFVRYDHLRQRSASIIDDDHNDVDKEKLEKNETVIRNEDNDEEEDEDEVSLDERKDDADEEDEDEEEESHPKRHKRFHDEEDIEVDVCREADISNPSSPVDLTASSRSDQFIHPFSRCGIHNPFSCVQNGSQGSGPGRSSPLYLTGQTATGSTVVVTSCNSTCHVPKNTSGNITTTTNSVQGVKRGLAFSVENILDPNKFTGGRPISHRLQHCRRRRSGSIHEGTLSF